MKKERILITGGAGFIGSHLTDYFMEKGHHVIVLDNLSSGKLEYISRWIDTPNFEFHKMDLRNYDETIEVIKNVDVVFHFASNPEVRIGAQKPSDIWENNVITTYNVLEAMRKNKVKYIVFASSSTVYGDAKKLPTPEDYSPLKPISVYGASKLACEALISGYAHTFKIKALILRYANVIGPRIRHGVIYDFIMKLKRNPHELEILGDGTQRKSYIYISDAIDATVHLYNIFKEKSEIYDVFNVGSEDWITVKEIAEIVSKILGVNPRFYFTGGVEEGRGWPGDVKYMLLDIKKLEKTGWKPKYSSKDAVEKTAKELVRELL